MAKDFLKVMNINYTSWLNIKKSLVLHKTFKFAIKRNAIKSNA